MCVFLYRTKQLLVYVLIICFNISDIYSQQTNKPRDEEGGFASYNVNRPRLYTPQTVDNYRPTPSYFDRDHDRDRERDRDRYYDDRRNDRIYPPGPSGFSTPSTTSTTRRPLNYYNPPPRYDERPQYYPQQPPQTQEVAGPQNYPPYGSQAYPQDNRDRDVRYRPPGQHPYPGQITSTPAPGVLGSWRTDLQGDYRQGISTRPPRDITVNTNYGRVQGFEVELYDLPGTAPADRPGRPDAPGDRKKAFISTFLGVPYAQAPVGEGRFRPPRASRGWSLWQAVDYAPACPQPLRYIGITRGIRKMDEDCLYLNIFSPSVGGGASEPYPVMMYFHDGQFEHGSSSSFPGHMLAAWGKVVVITVNYRLGALGFLSTADENSPGNYGLLDQAMALKWVYDNVRNFNGDHNKITLFGPGAGAASAGILLVSPKTRRMVYQVIAQSGSATADWAVIQDKYRVMNTSKLFAEKVGCNMDTSYKLINCLRNGRSYHELGNVELKPMLGTFPWSGVVDGDMRVPGDGWTEGWQSLDYKLLPQHPRDILQQPNFDTRNLKYLCGVTKDEAAYMIYENKTMAPYFEVSKKFFDQKVNEFILQYNYTLNPEAIFNAIEYMYTYWPDPQSIEYMRKEYINFLSDVLYNAPNDEIMKLMLARGVPLYMYMLNTTVEALRIPKHEDWRAIDHDTEYYFLTGAPFLDPDMIPEVYRLSRSLYTEGDRNMSQLFLETYSNFARYGNPTPQAILSVYWEPAREGDLRFLAVNHTYNSTMQLNYRQWQTAFWNEYIPTVVGRLFPTYPPVTEYWWEPREPLQIAFWVLAGLCLLLIVLCVTCCLLWRSAKRQKDRMYSSNYVLRHSQPSLDMEMTSKQPLKMYLDQPDEDTIDTSSVITSTTHYTNDGREKFPVQKKKQHQVPQTVV